jgi:hypothetical protein
MVGVGGFLAGLVVGFGLAIALCRRYLRRLAQSQHADTDRQVAAAPPVAVPTRDTAPTRRPTGRPAGSPRARRRHAPAVATASPAPREPIATALGQTDITLPREIVEQVYAQLARLEVLERRDALRVVRRTDRR